MKLLRLALFAFIYIALLTSPRTFAANDPNPAVVQLRISCLEANAPLNNCFTDLSTLNTWIWTTRTSKPSAESPLLVEIGPGTFAGRFTCSNYGYVTLRGSGIKNTTITSRYLPITSSNCINMSFSHMTLQNTTMLGAAQVSGGSTFWNNVEINGMGEAWSNPSCGTAKGTHYWSSSKITAHIWNGGTTAYKNACDTSWIFGSEITAIGSSGAVASIKVLGGDVHVQGSVIRAMSETGAVTSEFIAAQVSGAGTLDIHGTGIDVISPAVNNIVALQATNGGKMSASGSAFNMSTGTGGTMTRIIANTGGDVNAPYFWQHIPSPAIISVTGADMAVYTPTSENPHLVIYDSTCTSSWFDSYTSLCKQ